ncbi:sigma-70 family RNA polymerase sigma factor [Actinoplanes sp. N902-109]|uniref:sigma-70 family RNA polymerase sigma factor n=1 Tax=Actinoplanes sp. (strain N902-109) TaxID=649831 RepID=UPI0003295C8D|nr:sigma-70 family RNA polymerase sigma factor [Actinoplanes sp. N902-109]AGL19717.1 putative glycosyl hydrolase [Actinoplanes sp. N902-109]
MAYQPDTATVVAARAGDAAAIDRLVAGYLPLVYTIVGRALDGHADVDDVVQDTMLRVLRNLGDLRDPEAFRSWLVAITVRQVRERYRVRRAAPDALLPDDVRDPGADFTDLAITRLELAGQRRETAEATRWLDEDNRELLSLWWLEASGELTRDEIVEAIEVTRQHAAVRIQRMKGQLETARVVVRALDAVPGCPELAMLTADWDRRPSPLWRKRIARHTRDCRQCAPAWSGLVAAEKLLVGMALVPVPASLGAGFGGFGTGTAAGSHVAAHAAGGSGKTLATKIAVKGTVGIGRRVLTAVLATGAVAGGGAAAVVYTHDDKPVASAAVVTSPAPAPRLSLPAAAPSPSVTPTSKKPSAKPSPSRSKKSKAPAAPVSATSTSAKKGVGTWQFDGIKGALADVGAGWYYNWGPDNDSMPGPADVQFVPMVWGKANVTDATLSKVRSESKGKVLLGFNEPDMDAQAHMSVDEALAAWPELEATGLRLGAPAVAYGADTDGGWLDRFMTGARQKGLRVDFIPLHWYGSDFSAAAVGQFLGYVDAVHKKYGLPVWVTEFGLMNFSGSPKYPTAGQEVAFIKGSTKGLESRSYVERYAWFGLPAVGDSVDYGLYKDAGTPTEAGKAYKAAG